MKKSSFILAITLLVCMMIPTIHAASSSCPEAEIIHTESGDFEIITTTIIHKSLARSNTQSADRIKTVKYDGKVIAKVTLSATFGYDGKTSWVESASGSHTTYDGWSYFNEKISKSGGTAELTATLFKLTEGTVPVDISLTCSPTGQIS